MRADFNERIPDPGESFGIGCPMIIEENVPLAEGIFELYEEVDGKEIIHVRKTNLLVATRKTILCNLIAAPTTNYRLGLIKLGTGGHNLVSGDITDPVEPIISQTDLLQPIVTKAASSYNFLPDNVNPASVRFNFRLETYEGNGSGSVAYTEAGMFSHNGIMFSRVTFVAYIKSADRPLAGRWTYNF